MTYLPLSDIYVNNSQGVGPGSSESHLSSSAPLVINSIATRAAEYLNQGELSKVLKKIRIFAPLQLKKLVHLIGDKNEYELGERIYMATMNDTVCM